MPQEQKVNVRKITLDVLIDVMENGAYSDKTIHKVLDNHDDMDKRDRAFLTSTINSGIYDVSPDDTFNEIAERITEKYKK